METMFAHPWWTTLWVLLVCSCFGKPAINIKVGGGGNPGPPGPPGPRGPQGPMGPPAS